MKEKILMKSVLEGYHFMDKIVKKLDANVISKSVNSHHTQGCNETLNLACEVLHLSNRKHKLLEIKALIEECIKSLPPDSAKVLMLKYVDGFKNADIAKMLGCGVKKVARLLDKAIGDVTLFFYAKGFGFLNLYNYLKDEDWLIGIFDHHLKYANRFSQKIAPVSFV